MIPASEVSMAKVMIIVRIKADTDSPASDLERELRELLTVSKSPDDDVMRPLVNEAEVVSVDFIPFIEKKVR